MAYFHQGATSNYSSIYLQKFDSYEISKATAPHVNCQLTICFLDNLMYMYDGLQPYVEVMDMTRRYCCIQSELSHSSSLFLMLYLTLHHSQHRDFILCHSILHSDV